MKVSVIGITYFIINCNLVVYFNTGILSVLSHNAFNFATNKHNNNNLFSKQFTNKSVFLGDNFCTYILLV